MGYTLTELVTRPASDNRLAAIRSRSGARILIGAHFLCSILSAKYFDSDSKLYYYGYRWYRPGMGRWTSRDPIGEEGGINLNAAIRNDLINATDCLGKRISIKREDRDGYISVIKVSVNLSIVVCSNPPEGVSELIKEAIESIWTSDVEYYINEKVQKGIGWTYEPSKQKQRIETVITAIEVVDRLSQANPDHHVFYLIDTEGRSNAEAGGDESNIYKNALKDMRVYAHEFGHWLGIDDAYIEDSKEVRVSRNHDDIMAYGKKVYIYALNEASKNFENIQLNKGLPRGASQRM